MQGDLGTGAIGALIHATQDGTALLAKFDTSAFTALSSTQICRRGLTWWLGFSRYELEYPF
jgi:hypothetical protein